VTTGDKARVILFWSLMVSCALVLVKMNAVAEWFAKMNITAPGDGINRMLNYIPLAFVVTLFLFVWGTEQRRKSRERTSS